MIRRAAPLAAALAVLAFAGPAGTTAQQTPQIKPFTLEVEVDVVSVTAVVFDKKGTFIRDLSTSDIELFEDGVPQDVDYFREASSEEAERVPLTVVLVLDTSGSMNKSMRFLQEAVLNFVYKLEDVDTAMVVSFNESVKGSAEFTGDLDRLERIVDGLEPWGGTSLYDAIHYSLNRIRDAPGRKAVIVFSDGADTTSSLRDRDVVDYARAVEATVYAIGFKGSGPGGSAKGFLKKVSKETGGQFFSPGNVGDLIKVFNAISDELKNHYLLAYTPKREADGSWREIELKVKKPDVKVRVRKGYFHMQSRRSSD
jgi:VWFA-related protein